MAIGSRMHMLVAIVTITLYVALSTSELLLATPLEQHFDKRATFYGGWALVADSCPSNTTLCGLRTCCPTGTSCDRTALSNACCPTTTDCSQVLISVPVCADPSWQLYGTIHDPMCCLAGQIGVQPGSGDLYGSCVGADDNIPSSLRATAISPSTASVSSSATAATAGIATQATTTSHSAAMQATSSSSNPSNSSSSAKFGLSGTTIGAIVGGVVGGLAIIGAIALFFVLRNKRKYKSSAVAHRPPPPGAAPAPSYEPAPEKVSFISQSPSPAPPELYGNNYVHQNATPPPAEVYGGNYAQYQTTQQQQARYEMGSSK